MEKRCLRAQLWDGRTSSRHPQGQGGLGAPGKWAHLAFCSSKILALGEQAATIWDMGEKTGAGVL